MTPISRRPCRAPSSSRMASPATPHPSRPPSRRWPPRSRPTPPASRSWARRSPTRRPAPHCRSDCIIYPMFMAEGWFTGVELPRRLTQAGAPGAHIMRPFGTDPGPRRAGHRKGAPGGRRPGLGRCPTRRCFSPRTDRSAGRPAMTSPWRWPPASRRISPAWSRASSNRSPSSPDAARATRSRISLPLFALRAEHVLDDLPQALDQAGFTGPRLDPVGLAPEVPAMIAASIAKEVSSLK